MASKALTITSEDELLMEEFRLEEVEKFVDETEDSQIGYSESLDTLSSDSESHYEQSIESTPSRISTTSLVVDTDQATLKATIQSEIGHLVYEFPYERFLKIVFPRTPLSNYKGNLNAKIEQFEFKVDGKQYDMRFPMLLESARWTCHSNLNLGWGPNVVEPIKSWLACTTEQSYYIPIQELLNSCIEIVYGVLRKEYGANKQFYYRGLTFKKYETVTGDKSCNSAGALKPDLIGYIAKDNTKSKETPKGYWGEVPSSDSNGVHIEMVVEVKGNWRELAAQAGTYARCQFIASPSRTFVLVLGFNLDEGNMRFMLYHRSGLTATEKISLKDEEGRKEFLGILLAVLSWQKQSDAGFPEYTDGVEYVFREKEGYSVWKIVAVYHDSSNCVRGRATVIYKLQKVKEIKDISEWRPVEGGRLASKNAHSKDMSK